jgi:hypothetical protein
MTNLSNKFKDHAQRATNMSFGDIVKGSGRLVSNTISLGFKAIGATVYIADKSVRTLGAVGKSAYDETKKGYRQTDDILSSPEAEQPKPMATKREPQQMELDLE